MSEVLHQQTRDGGLVASVVIPTRNRSHLLRETLESLWKQTLDPKTFEIVVLDNLSTDDTAAIVREMQGRSPCALRYHLMPENRGPASSRNMGVRLARAPIIAFTDSDCAADPEWLARGLPAFRDNIALVTGSVLDKPGQVVRFFTRTNSGVQSEHPTYPTCNAMYRRDVFLEMGGFDENLCFADLFNRVTECADTDLAWRIKKNGYASAFVREMIIYHEVDMQTPWAWMSEPFRLYVLPALVKRHPELRRLLLKARVFFSPINLLFYLAVIGPVLGAATHWSLSLLALPFVAWAALAGNTRLTLKRLPRIPARVVLLAARQAFMCAGLIYGSARFRSVVL